MDAGEGGGQVEMEMEMEMKRTRKNACYAGGVSVVR